MHSVEEMGATVPAFLAKLWKMVEDTNTNDLISWSPGGTSFFIRNQARFSRELLPLYYKHNNMASFVRQLNMYGFHKVVSLEGGSLKVDKDEMEFAHPFFLMGHSYLLEHIKRKIPSTKSEESRPGHKPEMLNKVVSDVKTMKGRQDSVDSQLTAMKRENEVLWREVAILRQKHVKQQQIVNKLIQFLVSMVQSSRSGSGIGIKRHYPLMLNDIAHRSNKSRKLSRDISNENEIPCNSSPSGPVIHELDPELLDDFVQSASDENTTFLPPDLGVNSGEVRSPAPPSNTSKESAAINLDQSNCDVLLDLVDEYRLSPEILKAASPAEVSPCINSTKDKKKIKKRMMKRKAKTAVKTESVEDESLNVGDFLEIIIPSLVLNTSGNASETNAENVNIEAANASDIINEEAANASELMNAVIINPSDMMDAEVVNASDMVDADVIPDNVIVSDANETPRAEEQDNLATATNAAISAINNVAASSTNTAEESNDAIVPESSSNTTNAPWDMILACQSNTSSDSNSIKRCGVYKDDLDSHLGSMQSDLDTLKDILQGEGYSLDANTLLGLFGDELLSYGISMVQDPDSDKPKKENSMADPLVSGSELATYSTNLLDLEDLCDGAEMDDWSLPETRSSFESSNEEVNTPQVVLINGLDFPTVSKKKKK